MIPKQQSLSAIYFFYKICCDIDNYQKIEEAQALYNAMVKLFSLEEHSKKVLKAVIQQHVKSKMLTRQKKQSNSHPFDFVGTIHTNYKEDSKIHDKSGQWNSETIENINLIRAVFADKKEWFPQIIAFTFFYSPNPKRKTFTIPSKIEIPTSLIKASQNTSFVDFFINAFNLSTQEGQLLNIACLSHTNKELDQIFNTLVNQEMETRISIYAKCLNKTVREINRLLRNDTKLISYGILDKEGNINQDYFDCIFAKDFNILFSDVLKPDNKNEPYALDTFSIKKDEQEIALHLLHNSDSANILLYGTPGSGKTEYARSLVKACGLTPLLFENELEVDSNEDNATDNALCRLNCFLSLKNNVSVIIVEEAESLLSTNYFPIDDEEKKVTINRMLENNINKVIWIVNNTNAIDESTLRRFTYSIKFKELPRKTLQLIALSKLNKIEMSAPLHTELVNLCGEYHVGGTSVDNIVKTIKGMNLSHGNETKIVNNVKKVLEANSALLYGKKNIREKVKNTYDLSILNTSISAQEIVGMVTNAQAFSEKNESEDTGIRMLFYGASGTGKTELARYIAEKLNKKILLKRASDIFSKYVGEDEKNIKKAFEEAEARGDILLFDEADSFFADRNLALQSWERTSVNEFLTQMEEFNGIMICTTNLRQIMDPAMQRRFHILAEFKPLKKDGIEKLLCRFFSAYQFTPEQRNSIEQYESVTPGDFASLAGKIRFMPSEKINSEIIISELCKIQAEKSCNNTRRIGFVS